MTLSYKILSDSKTKTMMKKITKVNPDHGLQPNHVKIMTQDLRFAPSWQCVKCEDYSSVPNRFQTYLSDGKNLNPAHYTVDPYGDNHFNAMNLNLSDDVIVGYIEFYYSFFVKNGDGLRLISQSEDIQWQDEISPSLRQSIDSDLTNYPVITPQKDGWRVVVSCVFRQSILCVTFFVNREGMIEIEAQHSLVDDLPIH
jgi:hypothetical protein